jgi:hypothetical protein
MINNYGFNSRSSRFQNKKKDSTPGPGSYNPKPVSKQIKGGSFSKEKRFPVTTKMNVKGITTSHFKEKLILSIRSKIQTQIEKVPLFRSEPYKSRLNALNKQLDKLQRSQQPQSKNEFVKEINVKLKNCFKDRHFSISKPQKKIGISQKILSIHQKIYPISGNIMENQNFQTRH